MWKNQVTDDVFETMEDAVDAIYDDLDYYTNDLSAVLSEYDETWIFQHLTPEAQEKILQEWVDCLINGYLTECDDE